MSCTKPYGAPDILFTLGGRDWQIPYEDTMYVPLPFVLDLVVLIIELSVGSRITGTRAFVFLVLQPWIPVSIFVRDGLAQ